MAESSALFPYVVSDFGSIHGWPVKVTSIFFISDLFSLKGREEAQISANIKLSFWRNYHTI